MAKLSRTVKEVIKTTVVVVVVGVLIAVYAIYPLIRSKTMTARTDLDDFNPDSLVVNNPGVFADSGRAVDTFRVECDGLTNLACLYLAPPVDSSDAIRGTVCLLHADGQTRDDMLPVAEILLDSGYAVAACDQRASGRSTGQYRGDGQYEASDLQEVIRYLDIREKVIHPLYLVGIGLGGDAALLVAEEEPRVDAVVAVSPYLSTTRMLDRLKERHEIYSFPFFRTVMWWWYNMRSSYAAPYRETEDVRPVKVRTLLLNTAEAAADPEVARLTEASDPGLLTHESRPASEDDLYTRITMFVTSEATTPPPQE